MTRALVTLCVVLVLFLGPMATAASSQQSRSFLGLWQGIDPDDGSGVLYSFSDNDRDGVIEIIGRETFFTVCNGDGVIKGTGVVESEGRLVAQLVVTCRPGPTKVAVTMTFQLIPRDDVLILVPAAAISPITLHRVSHR